MTGPEATPSVEKDALTMLVRRGVITTDPEKAQRCCGLDRDADGFCWHRPGHPIYVSLPPGERQS